MSPVLTSQHGLFFMRRTDHDSGRSVIVGTRRTDIGKPALVPGLQSSKHFRILYGDIVLLARNDPHVLASGPGLAPVVPDDLIEPGSGALARLRLGGGGAPTRIVCGFLGTAVPGNPLVATLPAVLRVAVPAGPDGAWMDQAFRMAVRESDRRGPGAAAMLARLSELLFIAAIRRHMADLPAGGTGWLAGLGDPQVGRALALLHARVAEPWTAATLAAAAGLSRSAFAERFARLIGVPPMRYLANWRMQVAAGRLRDGGGPIARIGWEVGYASEAAFCRAFARAHGTTPAAWRRGDALAGRDTRSIKTNAAAAGEMSVGAQSSSCTPDLGWRGQA